MSINASARETVAFEIFSVIYRLEGADWTVLGEGWSQVRILLDDSSRQYRLVGWNPAHAEANPSTVVPIVSFPLTHACKAKRKSDDFHRVADAAGNTWGFGFYVKDGAALEPPAFLSLVTQAIAEAQTRHVRAKQQQAATAGAPGSGSVAGRRSSGGVGSGSPQVAQTLRRDSDIPVVGRADGRGLSLAYQSTVGTLGRLEILPEKQAKQATSTHADSISPPIAVTHDAHATYDPATGHFAGLPADWEAQLLRQYGVDLAKVDAAQVPGYTARLPRVLVVLFRLLEAKRGFEAEGIFRIAAEAAAADRARAAVDAGALVGRKAVLDASGLPVFDYDVHTLASLIKVWFRDLPVKLLDAANKGRVSMCETEAEAAAIVDALPEPYRSTCLFLVDRCVAIARSVGVNKMTSHNLAICFGPNLFTSNPADPMAALVYSQKVVKVMKLAIDHRAGK